MRSSATYTNKQNKKGLIITDKPYQDRIVYTKDSLKTFHLDPRLLKKTALVAQLFTSSINKIEVKDDNGKSHVYSLIDILDGLTLFVKKQKEEK